MVAELLADGAIILSEAANPGEVVTAHTQRVRVQEDVEIALAAASPDDVVVVLADMAAERNEFRGNVGARLVRGLAQRPGVADRVIRVMWTGQAVVTVTAALGRWAHATAAYRPDSWGDLADALLYSLQADRDGHRVFPEARPHDTWREDVRERIEELVGENADRTGDDLIALSMFQGVLDGVVNEKLKELRQKVPDARRNVHQFVDAVRRRHNLQNPEQARRRIKEWIGPVAEEHIDDEVDPELVENARECLRTTLDGYTDEEKVQTTWLTPAELQLAQRFIRRHSKLVGDLHTTKLAERWQILLDLRGRARRGPDPVWAQTMQDLGLNFEHDLSYALWTLKDVHQAL